MTTTDSGKSWLTPLLSTWRGRRAWVLEQQISIARTAAPTGNESVRAALLQQDWQDCGHAVEQDRAGNVITRVLPTWPCEVAERRPLVCLAHLDTVFDADHTGSFVIGTKATVQAPRAQLAVGDDLAPATIRAVLLPVLTALLSITAAIAIAARTWSRRERKDQP